MVICMVTFDGHRVKQIPQGHSPTGTGAVLGCPLGLGVQGLAPASSSARGERNGARVPMKAESGSDTYLLTF